MKTKFLTLTFLGAFALPFLYGCEVSTDDLPTDPDPETPVVEIASIELLSSSPQLQSDGSTEASLSAIAKDANNQVVEGVSVIFSADSGALQVDSATTNAQGIASATLTTGGDPSNRVINVTATTSTLTDTIGINVIGTSIQIQGPSSLALGDSGSYTVTLADSGGNGISGKAVTVSSSASNSLSANSLTTDSSGRAQFTLTADNSGADTLTASALPDSNGSPTSTTTFDVNVSGDSFRFTSPATGTEIDLGATQTVTVRWEKSGTPQPTETINFATTRGTLSASSAVTDANGDASVDVSANTAGPGVITATNDEGTSTQLSVEFVATTPDQISLQADPSVISIDESSTITAVVTDAANNRVKNQTIEFTLTDSTGGSLATSSAVTDSLGRAQTVYNASSAPSADDGVIVTGQIVGTGLQDSTSLTVSGRALFIVFGTGNTIIENEPDTTYTKDYSLFVSDSSGKGVSGANVSLRMLPTGYMKGYLAVDTTTNKWYPVYEAFCDNEDTSSADPEDWNNGVLDAGEDFNGDGELTPGNVAVVNPGTVTTDENGEAVFSVTYPQNYALWVTGRITAATSVSGTESRKSANFYFPMSDEDTDASQAPPNPFSPWGVSADCSNTD